ncbi:hypothetical protein [Pedobacter panaciterrae]|uniref:hypothetical protein n=1 Tax=Pedobacter panaciterrae TaxID=363849 RepID=UPI002595575B|nr:hypothetical protein [uncultured Pedobacter sp.]
MAIVIFIAFIASSPDRATCQDLSQQNEIFWHTNIDHAITWDLTAEKRLPHDDNLEMSGSLVSGIIRYKVNKAKQVEITRDVIFPQLRKYTKSNESMYRPICDLNMATTFYPLSHWRRKNMNPAFWTPFISVERLVFILSRGTTFN